MVRNHKFLIEEGEPILSLLRRILPENIKKLLLNLIDSWRTCEGLFLHRPSHYFDVNYFWDGQPIFFPKSPSNL